MMYAPTRIAIVSDLSKNPNHFCEVLFPLKNEETAQGNNDY